MEKSGISAFECYKDPATLGPRWTRWLTSFELYADGKGLIIEEGVAASVCQRRRALLLHHAGPDVQDIFSTLPNTGNADDFNAAVAALNAYFVPRVNTAYARQSFYKLSQNSGETVQQFTTRLRQAARDCAFADDLNNQLRDAVVGRGSSTYVRRKLLEEGPNLTLDRALEVADLCERIEEQMSASSVSDASKSDNTTETVNRVWKKGGKYTKGKHQAESTESQASYVNQSDPSSLENENELNIHPPSDYIVVLPDSPTAQLQERSRASSQSSGGDNYINIITKDGNVSVDTFGCDVNSDIESEGQDYENFPKSPEHCGLSRESLSSDGGGSAEYVNTGNVCLGGTEPDD